MNDERENGFVIILIAHILCIIFLNLSHKTSYLFIFSLILTFYSQNTQFFILFRMLLSTLLVSCINTPFFWQFSQKPYTRTKTKKLYIMILFLLHFSFTISLRIYFISINYYVRTQYVTTLIVQMVVNRASMIF